MLSLETDASRLQYVLPATLWGDPDVPRPIRILSDKHQVAHVRRDTALVEGASATRVNVDLATVP